MQGDQSLDIRPATNSDGQRVRALIFSVLTEYGLPCEPHGKDSDLQDLEANYFRSGGLFEVLEDEAGNILGTYGLYRLDPGTCELRKMYFVPEIRGKGYGRLVLDRAVQQARNLGFKAIVLETISVLKEAIRLYTRYGFLPVEIKGKTDRVDQAFRLELT